MSEASGAPAQSTSEPIKLTDDTPVFYQPGHPGIIDIAIERDGILTGAYSGEPLEAVRLRYPDAEIGTLGAVSEASDNYYRRGPVEITEQEWFDAFEVLPPARYRSGPDAEVFFMSERTSGSITNIFCRLGARYFVMADSFTLNHGLVISECQKRLQAAALSTDAQ